MNWHVAFEPSGSLVTLTVSGLARVDGFESYLEGVLADPAWRGGTPVLADFRGLELGHLRYADVERIVAIHAPYWARIGSSPIAVVVSRPVALGTLRQFQILASEMMCPVHEAFYEVPDALRWLHAQPPGWAHGRTDVPS
jgi:hypothetical protein